MSNVHVPGIRKKRFERHDDGCAENASDFYYAFNLQELPEEVAFGQTGYVPEQPTLKDYWTDHDLARLLFDPTETEMAISEEEMEAAASASLAAAQLISGCQLNDKAVEHAREGRGFHSRMLDADGAEIGPTILYVSVSRLRSESLQGLHEFGQRYQRLLSDRAYQVEVANRGVVDHLERFYKQQVRPLIELNEKLGEETEPVRVGLAKVHSAHLAMTAMMDFNKSGAERRKLWGEKEPKERDSWVYSRDVLPEPPNGQHISNAEQLLDNNLEPLAGLLSNTLRWMNTGATERGKTYETARKRNLAARQLLDALRNDHVIGQMLDNHHLVPQGEWFVLDNLLVDAFVQISTAPDVLPDLLACEVMALTRVAARRDCYIEAKSGVTVRERELSGVMATMVPDIELQESPTTLSNRLIALRDTADRFKTHSDTFVRLWAASMPPMLHQLGRIGAQKGVDPSSYRRAALIRSMFGSTTVPENQQLSLWQSLNKVARTRDKRKAALEVFDKETGLLAATRRHMNSDLAWKGFKGIAALVALHETFTDGKKKPAMYTIDGIKAVLEAAGAGLEFAETLTAAPGFMKAASHRGEALFDALDGVSDHPMFKGLGVATAMLDLIGSVVSSKMTYTEAKTMTETQKDIKKEKILLSGVQLALTIATAFAAPMPVASLVLFIGQSLILSREQWMAKLLPNVKSLPGTGRFVRGVWKSLQEDVSFRSAFWSGPWAGSIDAKLKALEGWVADVSQSERGNFWPISDGGLIRPEIVKRVLVQQYGFDESSAAGIASR